MESMHPIIKNKLTELTELCKQYRVKVMYVFGSGSTGLMKESSDIDLLISFEEGISIDEYTDNYFSLQYCLREMFSREIDLVTESSLSNPFFIKGVEQTKQLIYGA